MSFVFTDETKIKDAGFPIKDVGNDRRVVKDDKTVGPVSETTLFPPAISSFEFQADHARFFCGCVNGCRGFLAKTGASAYAQSYSVVSQVKGCRNNNK